MNASYNKLHALRRRGLATALVSIALLAVSAPTLLASNPVTTSACQGSGACGV